MPKFIFNSVVKKIEKNSRILIMGLTFKENVKDIRNSKSAILEYLFKKKGYKVDVYDPNADKQQAFKEYAIKLVKPKKKYQCIIVTVGHKEFTKMPLKRIINLCDNNSNLIDIKNIWEKHKFPPNILYWSL